jgi:magnesium transporter
VIESIVYDADGQTAYDDLAAAKAATGTTWVRATRVTDAELAELADTYESQEH